MDTAKQRGRRPLRHFVRVNLAIYCLVAVAIASIAVEFAIDHDGVSGGHRIAAFGRYLRNPLALFASRSPGARGFGALAQTKNRAFHLAGKSVEPHQRVLSNIRYAPSVPSLIDDLVGGAGPSPLAIDWQSPQISQALAKSGLKAGAPPRTAPGVPAILPSTAPASGGGGSAPPTVAVPEPATWCMLIWGMFLVGLGLRSSHADGAGREACRKTKGF